MKLLITGCIILLLAGNTAMAQQLMERPAAEINVDKAYKYAEIRTWQFNLPNGVTLVVRPDETVKDVQLRGFCKGGAAGMPAADYYSAIHAGAIIMQSGAGKYDRDTLAALLQNQHLQLNFAIEDNRAVINASCEKATLETLLQLIYLYCTAPQKNMAAYTQYIQQLTSLPQTSPYTLTLNELLRENGKTITPSTIRSISLDKAYHAFQQCFGNASGFTFVITGDLNANGMNNSRLTPLIAKYLGTLPAAGTKHKPAVKAILVPAAKMVKTLKADQDSLVTATWVFRNNYAFSDSANLQLKMAARIFYKRLVHERRLAGLTLNSLSYSLKFYKFPLQQYHWRLSYECTVQQAARMEQVMQAVVKSMQDSIATNEINDYVDRAKQDLKRNFVSNAFWTDYLLGQCYLQEDADIIASYPYNYRMATTQTVLQSARQVWRSQNYIQVTATPGTKN